MSQNVRVASASSHVAWYLCVLGRCYLASKVDTSNFSSKVRLNAILAGVSSSSIGVIVYLARREDRNYDKESSKLV